MVRIVLASALIAAGLASPATTAEIASTTEATVVDRGIAQTYGHWHVYWSYSPNGPWTYYSAFDTWFQADHAMHNLRHSGFSTYVVFVYH